MDQPQETDGFMVECAGPLGLFGLFEDDGETGYLYLYHPVDGILNHHWIYNRRSYEPVEESDVEVRWNDETSEFQAWIKGVPRGAIRLVDLAKQRETQHAERQA